MIFRRVDNQHLCLNDPRRRINVASVRDVLREHGLYLPQVVVCIGAGVEVCPGLCKKARKLLAGGVVDPERGARQVHLVDGGNERQRWLLGVRSVHICGILFERFLLHGPQKEVGGGKLRGAHDGNHFVHHSRCIDRPFKYLHAAHGLADHGVDMHEVKRFAQQPLLGPHHVADGENRECRSPLCLAVGGRRRNAVTKWVDDDHEILARVEEKVRPRADERAHIAGAARKPHRE